MVDSSDNARAFACSSEACAPEIFDVIYRRQWTYFRINMLTSVLVLSHVIILRSQDTREAILVGMCEIAFSASGSLQGVRRE